MKGDSVRHLPPALADDAYALEENGRWERVYYNGEYREMWRPTTVAAGWAPFTAGRWTEYYGDNTWIPAEPFGYCTHHYGNWVNVNGGWFWAPPVVAVGVVAPVPWYPGRVAWIGSGADVGWVPLAPAEPYYAHRAWGPAATVIGTAAVVGVTIASLAYVNHAIVVPQRSFYGVNNYTNVRVTNINHTTIINNYRAAPVVNNTIIQNYDRTRARYNFTDVAVANKPHQTTLARIEQNDRLAKQAATVNAKTLERNITAAKVATPVKTTALGPPKVTSKIVPASEVNKPAAQVKFQQQEIKTKVKPAEVKPTSAVMKPGGVPAGKPPMPGTATPSTQPGAAGKPGLEGKPLSPAGQPAKGADIQPTTPGKPGEVKGLQAPQRPGTATPSTQPGATGKPGLEGKPLSPAGQPAKGADIQPTTPGKPGEVKGLQAPQRPGTVTPSTQPGATGKPGADLKSGEQPGQVSPGRSIAPVGKPSNPAVPGEVKKQTPAVQPLQPTGPTGLPSTSPTDKGKGVKSPAEGLRPTETRPQPGTVKTPLQETTKPSTTAPKSSGMQQQNAAAGAAAQAGPPAAEARFRGTQITDAGPQTAGGAADADSCEAGPAGTADPAGR